MKMEATKMVATLTKDERGDLRRSDSLSQWVEDGANFQGGAWRVRIHGAKDDGCGAYEGELL